MTSHGKRTLPHGVWERDYEAMRLRRRGWVEGLAFAHGEDPADLPRDPIELGDWMPLDSYLIAELWLHIHIRDFTFGNECRDICLTSAKCFVEPRLGPIDLDTVGAADPFVVDGGDDCRQDAMFVQIGEHSEPRQRILGRILWHTPVWLRLLDSCPHRFGDPLQFSGAQDLKLAAVGENRELAVSITPRDLMDKMVQRPPEVMDRLSGKQWPVVRGSLPLDRKTAALDFLGRSLFTLGPELIGLRTLEGHGLNAKGLDLSYAPRELPVC